MSRFEKDYDLARTQIMKSHDLSADFVLGLSVALLTDFLKGLQNPSDEDIAKFTKESIRIANIADKARVAGA